MVFQESISSGKDIQKDGVLLEEQNIDHLDTESEALSEGEVLRRQKVTYKIQKFLWDSVDKSPEERRFLFKLDFFLLSSAMLGYFIKNLNQSNINSAYINGMREDLHMTGNQLNYMQTLWTVGYIIGQVPSNLILHRISARYYLGGLEILWATLTVCMTACNDVHQVYAIRFLVGLTESGFFPGMEYLVGSWYSKEELTKRSSLFAVAGTAGQMVTGFIVTAIIHGIGKTNTSLPSWKWLFVVDAIISYPVAFYTMAVDPNTPSTCTAWYFTDREKEIAIERRKRIGAQLNTRQPYTFSKIKSIFNTWHIWVFPLVFLCYNNSCNSFGQPTFPGWMKYSLKMTVDQYNLYPTSALGASIGVAIAAAYIADYFKGLNWPFVILFFSSQIFGCACLAHWHIPRALHWFSYYILYMTGTLGQPMIYSWINRLLFYDDQKRNLTVVVTNTLAYVTQAWVPILTWNAKDIPIYHKGFTYTACLSSFGLVFTLIALYLTKRDEKIKKHATIDQHIGNEKNSTKEDSNHLSLES